MRVTLGSFHQHSFTKDALPAGCKRAEYDGALGVNLEDLSAGLQVRQPKLDFAVKAAWSKQSRVKGIRAVGSHQNLDVAARVKPIELVHDFKHGSLNLIVPPRSIIETSTANRIHFIEEHYLSLIHISEPTRPY